MLTPLSDLKDPSIPNWRELYLAKIEKYENYLKKYPNSPLMAEVKLRIAELTKDVERPEIYGLRLKMYQCIEENSGELDENGLARDSCISEFHDKTKNGATRFTSRKLLTFFLNLLKNTDTSDVTL